MTSTILAVKFGESSKTYCFSTDDPGIREGDRVVVESELGISLGRVASLQCEMDDPSIEVKPILRRATEADLRQEDENESFRLEAQKYCHERIEERGLEMKLLTTEVTLDRKRYIFYFTAESRIDFRELVKDLASKLRTRIELRQVGVRDAARVVGGYGVCGREFCCKTFLKTFAPISIKMAKQQELVLNTCKLSGSCGRLMCCLNYEYEDEQTFRARKAREAEEARLAAEAKRMEEERRAEEERLERQERERQEAEMLQRIREREAQQPQTQQEEKKEERPSRKKRRRPRRKSRPEGQATQPQQQGGQPGAPASQAQAGGGQPQGDSKQRTGGEGKPRRRRRRRPKGKPKSE
jgi:cell fate regulator YaaT (PSP1 superfamily)